MTSKLVYGIDVGTTKIVAIAGRADGRRGWVEVLSMGEAPSHGLPVTRHAPRSAGSVAYLKLAKEVAARG